MFRGNNARCRFQPQTGDQVVVTGGMDVYAPQGRLNLIVRTMTEDGAGDMQRQLEALKQKLSEEGCSTRPASNNCRACPSALGGHRPTGAAFQDILKVLSRRFPGRHVFAFALQGSGDGSAATVVEAIDRLVADGRAEVIIFGRGGGSPEDLMAFNDEELARAVAACPIPIVSAVGHEVDVSISDLVADVRAATPACGGAWWFRSAMGFRPMSMSCTNACWRVSGAIWMPDGSGLNGSDCAPRPSALPMVASVWMR